MDFKTFLENFDAIAEAPGGIQKLRSLILALAVRGKLVPQNPEDEPAELLRNQIVVEKQNLEKSKKIAKQRSLTPVQENEQPYLLPSNWCWCRWNDVALHIGDIDHKMPTEVFEGIPYVSPRDFKKENTIDFEGAKKISYEDFERLKRKVQPTKGDIIFPRYGTIGENRLVEVDIDFLASYSCTVIKNFHGYIEPKYSYYYSISKLVKSEIERYTNKTTQANVGIQSIQNFIYPLPPLAEQKRIVEKVDELMALCDNYEAAKQTRDNLRQQLRGSAINSLMNAETDEELDASWEFVRDNWQNLSQQPEDVGDLREATLHLAVRGKLVSQNFNDEPASALLKRAQIEKKSLLKAGSIKKNISLSPISKDEKQFVLPANWEWVRGQDISIFVTSGSRGWAQYYSSSGAIFIRVGNLDYGTIELDLESLQFVNPPEGAEGTRTRVARNDILISMTGDTGMIGLVRSELLEAYINQHIGLLRPVRCIYAEYIARFLSSNLALKQLKQAQRGIKNSLGLEDIRNLVISLPPIDEQKRIVAKVDELMQLCDQLEDSLLQSQQRAESLAASAISHLTI
ncbi:restriction endonuclease subunit S [Cyanobacteria bacterium FACHB-472]|nr:restriction endonuclease subunit S [Cyanobacteria bacterium FACHB-472]